jgi:hypothetical protein
MKKFSPAISARGFTLRGRRSAAPGFPPVAAWGANPHVSNSSASVSNVASLSRRPLAEFGDLWRTNDDRC